MIVSFAPDLLMRSKIDVAARHYGVTVRQTQTEADCRAALAEANGPNLVLLDLDAEGLDGPGLVRSARAYAPAARVVGYCSHVLVDLIRESREAGAHSVMANSTFAAAVPGLIAEVAQAASTPRT